MKQIDYTPLLKLLVVRRIKMVNLVNNKIISWNIVKKINKGEPISFGTILKICDFLDCDISDVVILKKGVVRDTII